MFSLIIQGSNFSTMSRGHSPTRPLTLPHLGTHIIIFDLRLELPPRANMLLIIHKSDRTWSRRHSGAIESPYWWFQMGDLPNTRPMEWTGHVFGTSFRFAKLIDSIIEDRRALCLGASSTLSCQSWVQHRLHRSKETNAPKEAISQSLAWRRVHLQVD